MYEQSASNVIKDLRELQALTADQDGAHRVAWGPFGKKLEIGTARRQKK